MKNVTLYEDIPEFGNARSYDELISMSPHPGMALIRIRKSDPFAVELVEREFNRFLKNNTDGRKYRLRKRGRLERNHPVFKAKYASKAGYMSHRHDVYIQLEDATYIDYYVDFVNDYHKPVKYEPGIAYAASVDHNTDEDFVEEMLDNKNNLNDYRISFDDIQELSHLAEVLKNSTFLDLDLQTLKRMRTIIDNNIMLMGG